MNSAAFSFSAFQGTRLHLGVCGSVAAYKALELMRGFQALGVCVSACLTNAATRFITPLSFASLGADPVYTAMFGQDEGPRFAHLEPGAAADAFLVAPATATTIARLAHGLADDLLSAQALAFSGPLIYAPAMNPRMWRHAATQANCLKLAERGAILVEPASGAVACGDSGRGRLADIYDIMCSVLAALSPQDFAGQKVLVTLGPTREDFDGVRYWSNGSTGLMGACLAHALHFRGAAVHAVAGPGVPQLPSGLVRHDVRSAAEMYAAAADIWPDMDKGVFTAAVADFSPEPHSGGKFKKTGRQDGFDLHFRPNADILASLGAAARPDQRLLGFAAETGDLEKAAREKRSRKGAHLMAGNYLGKEDSGFASARNTLFVCDSQEREEHWPALSKADAAWRLLDWLLTL